MVQADNFDFQQIAQALVRAVAHALNHATLFAVTSLLLTTSYARRLDALKAALNKLRSNLRNFADEFSDKS